MADRETKLTLRISDDGTISVLDRAGQKLASLGQAAEQLSGRAASGFSRFGASVVTLNQAMDLAQRAFHAARGAVEMFLGVYERAGAMHEFGMSLGMAAKDLNLLSAAARLGNTDVGALGMSIGVFSKKLTENSEATQKLMAAMNISPRVNGQLKDTWTLLGEIGQVVSQLPDGQTKTALSMELMGRAGKAWIPIFNEGRDGLKNLQRTIDEIGAGSIPGFEKRADQLTDTLTLVKIGAEGLAKRVANELLKDVQLTADGMLNWEKANNKVLAQDIAGWIRKTSSATAELAGNIGNLAKWLDEHPNLTKLLLGGIVAGPVGAAAMAGNIAGNAVSGAVNQGLSNVDDAKASVRRWLGLPSTETMWVHGGGETFVPNATNIAQWGPPPEGFTGPPEPNADQRRLDILDRINKALATGTDETEKQSKAAKALADRYSDLFDGYLAADNARLDYAKHAFEMATRNEASDEIRLALAGDIDAAEIAILETKRMQAAQEYTLAGQRKATPEELGKIEAQYRAIDAQIDRGADNMAKLRDEISKAHRVTIDFGQTLGSGMSRALDGLFSSGNGVNLGALMKDGATAMAQEFATGLLKAELSEGAFDAHVTENFTVKLPGVFKSGAGALASIWGSLMSVLGGETDSAVEGMTSSWSGGMADMASSGSKLASWLGGTFRNVPGVGNISNLMGLMGGGGTQAGMGAVGGMSLLGGGEMSSAVGAVAPSAASGALSSGGAGGIAGLGASGGWIGAIIAGAILTGKGMFDILGGKGGPESTAQFGRSAVNGFGAGALPDAMFEALGMNVTGRRVIAGVSSGGITELAQVISDALGFKGFFGMGAPPTQEHLDLDAVRDAWDKTKLMKYGPAWGDHSIIGRSEEEIFQNRDKGKGGYLFDMLFPGGTRESEVGAPAISAMKGGAGAIGLAAFEGDAGKAAQFANAFIINARLMGLSADMAREQLLEFAQAAGVDAKSAVSDLAEQLSNGDITLDQYKTQVTEVVELFAGKLPAGVDASVIALNHFIEANGKAVFDTVRFNEALQKQVEIFGDLEKGIQSSLAQGIGAVMETDDTQAAYSQYVVGLRQAAVQAITAGAVAAVEALPQYSAFQTALAEAVKTGTTTGLVDAFEALGFASLTILNNAAQVAKLFSIQQSVTPMQLRSDQQSILDQIDQAKFGMLRPKAQLGFQSNRAAEIKAQLAAGGLSDEDRRKLLEEQRGIGEWYLQYGGQFAQGSRKQKQYSQQGIDILAETAAGFGAFADQQDVLIRSQDAAREAIDRLTAALDRTINAIDGLNRGGPLIDGGRIPGQVVDRPWSPPPGFTDNGDGTYSNIYTSNTRQGWRDLGVQGFSMATVSSGGSRGSDDQLADAIATRLARILATHKSGDINVPIEINVDGAGDANATGATTVRMLRAAMRDPAVRQEIRRIQAAG